MARQPVGGPRIPPDPSARDPLEPDMADREPLQQQTADLTDSMVRLTQACSAATAEMVAGSVQVFAGLVSDVAYAFARPMQRSPGGGRRAGPAMAPPVADIVESADRAVRHAASVVERAHQRFTENYDQPSTGRAAPPPARSVQHPARPDPSPAPPPTASDPDVPDA
jgi:hypothetical protein